MRSELQPDCGFVARAPKRPAKPANEMYPELFGAVQHHLREDFFVLNIGANDGVDNDPIHPFLLMYPEWQGVFVEPVPYNFAQLEHNYRRFEGVRLVQAAIAQSPGPMHYVMETNESESQWVGQIGSLDRSVVVESLRGLCAASSAKMLPTGAVSDAIEHTIVEDHAIACMTMEALIRECKIDRVDFLNIDAEGSDFEIFASFDLERFSPAILCIETGTFTVPQRRLFRNRIAKCGYNPACKFGPFSAVFVRS